MTRPRIDIVGAGLCGSLLAAMVARRGMGVTLWERRPDPRRTRQASGRSINLALSARGIRGLRYAGLFGAVERLLIPMRGRMIHDPEGHTELQPYGQREHERIYSVSRAALNRILVEHAAANPAVALRFRHAAERFDPRAGRLGLCDLDTGALQEIVGRPLIAADGAGSVIRRAYRSDSRIAPREEPLAHGYKELTLPPGPGGTYRLAPDALHIWPRGGFMLIALPNPGGHFTLTLFLPQQGQPSFASLDDAAQVNDFFATHFPDVRTLLPDLTTEFATHPTGTLGTVRCRHWYDGNTLLVGDAAHAIVPFHGQGMNLAFEDCVLLDRLVAVHGSDWPRVFARFEEGQLDNANAIADMALENYVEMRDRVREPQFVLRKALAFELERRLPERFIPRYSMVMFHDEIPFALARKRGAVQEALLTEIAAGAATLDDIDLDAAEERVRRALPPVAEELG